MERETVRAESRTSAAYAGDSPLRVLIVTPIFPPDIGGPATYVPKLAVALTGRLADVTVLTLSDSLDHDDSRWPFRVVRILRAKWWPWRVLRVMKETVSLARRADVLFVNGLTLECVLANMLARRPMVQKVVGDLIWERARREGAWDRGFDEFQRERAGLKHEALKTLRSWWTRRATRVIVPSAYLGRWVKEWGVPVDRVRVVYNAVDVDSGVARSPRVDLEGNIKVVTVARLVSWKGIDRLMGIVATMPSVDLVVVGDGPDRGHLEAEARLLGLGRRVFFAGQRSHQDTLALMAACDVFALNSTYEGLPHVVVEAMRLGLPVVATAVGGTPEVVQDGETGVLVQPGDDDGLRAALKALAASPALRERLGAAGRARARAFSLERMLGETEDVLREAVAGCR